MKRSPTVAAFILFVFLECLSANCMAEKQAGTISLTPSIGGYVFENNQDLNNTALYGLGIGYDITKRTGVEFLFNYADSESDLTHEGVGAYLFRLNYLYHFLVGKKFSSFVSAGGGLIRFDPDKGKNSTDALVDYGVGVKYFFNDSWSLRGDVQHIITFGDHNNNLAYTLGLSYLFGGKKPAPPTPQDSDGDGVPDSVDKCPGTPAVYRWTRTAAPSIPTGTGCPTISTSVPEPPRRRPWMRGDVG